MGSLTKFMKPTPVMEEFNEVRSKKSFKKSIKVSPPKKTFGRIDLNEFLVWMQSLDITKYPAQSAIIMRVQNYKRPAFVKDTVQLVNLFMEGRS